MIKHSESFLLTGFRTVDEYVSEWYAYKPFNYTTSDLRKTYCDKCSDVFKGCDGCFLHDVMTELYKSNPFA